MKIPLADPLIGEEEARAVYEVVKSGWIREGEIVSKFEKEFSKTVGRKYAIATSSGTAALHVALAALGIGKGDEVIMPSFTCAPPVSMTLLVGGKVVFADIEMETYNLDPESVKKLVSERTKVIIPINYAGHPAKLDVLSEIAEDKGIYLLNDAAEALGAKYMGKDVASFGDVVIFSFSPNKTITTGEGGMIVTDDEELAEKARIIKDYGQKGRFNNIEIGNNYHMTEMQAAIGLVQLKKLEEIVKRKRRNAKMLSDELSDIEGIKIPIEMNECKHVYCLYSIRVLKGSRDKVMKMLDSAGIQTRIYFPPVHKTPMMRKYNYKADSLKKTEEVANTILSLPSSPKLKEEEIKYIGRVIRNVIRKL